jgi:hypothetical protein
MLEVKIKDRAKNISELEARKRELETTLRIKTESAMKKVSELSKVGEKGKKPLDSQPTAKFLKN